MKKNGRCDMYEKTMRLKVLKMNISTNFQNLMASNTKPQVTKVGAIASMC